MNTPPLTGDKDHLVFGVKVDNKLCLRASCHCDIGDLDPYVSSESLISCPRLFCYRWEMVTVKKLYDLDPYVEWTPFLNQVFNPAIRIHRHTQVNLYNEYFQ